MTFKKTVLITGGGSGIGRATTEKFIENNWTVAVLGRKYEPLKELEEAYPEQVFPIICDLTHPDEIQLVPEKLHSSGCLSSLHAVIQNAAMFSRKPFIETTDEEWNQYFQTNLMGVIRLNRVLLDTLSKNQGTITHIASTLGLRPIQDTVAYSSIKAALINLTQGLALEWAPRKINVNCVCPGLVDTPIHDFHNIEPEEKKKILEQLNTLQPAGRIGQPRDIAHTIYWMTHPDAKWMTGSIVSIDGGIGLV